MSIVIKDLMHRYDIGTPYETTALEGITLEIPDGIFAGLIGHTGSGKSTLIQHLNGLLKPYSGEIIINGLPLHDKATSMPEIRKKVGLVFQYPEYQLFEETVYRDIAYGPQNLGNLSEAEIRERVIEAMKMVGLDFDTLSEKSPFELSGGQKRRVAIAGVIAMKPEILILDEPTAGLDPRGRDEIFKRLYALQRTQNSTVIVVSHSMEDVAQYADQLYVMDHGKVVLQGAPKAVFRHRAYLESIGLGVPQVTVLDHVLSEPGMPFFGKDPENLVLTVEEMVAQVLAHIQDKQIQGGADADAQRP